MMPRPHIDFGARRSLTAPAGWVLLVVASLALAMSGAQLWRAWERNESAQAQQDAARRQTLSLRPRAARPVTPADRLAGKQGQAVLRELTVPWQDLLPIVEDYAAHDVALIGIDQNPAQSQIRITAEAKDFDAMIAYLKYLQASALLRQAVLDAHLIETKVPGAPIRFQITAVWGKS